MAGALLEMRGICKEFSGVKALDDVSLCIETGEIHALCGENGAGKSTLMNVLSGIYPVGSYSGDIFFDGKECRFHNIRDSEKLGIVIIHQELALVPYLSIAENVFLGNERHRKGVINWDETIHKTGEMLERVGLKLNPQVLIKDIGVGQQQLVEIAKALSKNVRLLILDEPTASLNDEDSAHLLNLLVELKKQGMTSILISHKLGELEAVADSITILRDGRAIETLPNDESLNVDRIIKGMVGRTMEDRYPKRTPQIGDVFFEVQDWTVYDPLDDMRQVVKNVSFNVKRGEIIGIAGLMGAGRTELAMSIFGRSYGKKISGKVFKEGVEITPHSVRAAIDHGMAYVTEDRKGAGLILPETVKTNVSLASLDHVSKRGIVNEYEEILAAEKAREELSIKTPSIWQQVSNLSGGNQQKVVLAKWIYSEPDVFILDEPTRGIDVGAKYEIYLIVQKLANQGKAVVVISSDLSEILGVCDRIYVMNEGKFVGEMPREEASQEAVMTCIMHDTRR